MLQLQLELLLLQLPYYDYNYNNYNKYHYYKTSTDLNDHVYELVEVIDDANLFLQACTSAYLTKVH